MTRGWLLDTNVISEVAKGLRANRGVLAWIADVPEEQLYISVVTLGEIAKGIALGEGRDRDMRRHRHFLEREIVDRFGERILDLTAEAAIVWGRLMSQLHGNRDDERRLAIDGQIAAIALVHSLVVCSRNERDFARLGVTDLVNPFTAD